MFTNRGKKGSVITEAAIIIPFFIVALCCLLMLIIECGKEEKITHNLVTAAEAAQCVDAVTSSLSEKINIENIIESRTVKLEDTSIDNVYTLLFPGVFNMPGNGLVAGTKYSLMTLSFRPFVGESEGVSSETESKAAADEIVCVYPASGLRYHSPDCREVKAQTTKGNSNITYIRKDQAKLQGYSPCQVCRKGEQ